MTTPIPIPLTILAPGNEPGINAGNYIIMGKESLTDSKEFHDGHYWLVTVNRRTLKVVGNESTTNNKDIPASVKPYVGSHDFFIVLATYNISGNNLPTGAFYDFLLSAGAGTKLKSLEQAFEQLGTSSINWPSYVLVTTLDNTDANAVEELNFTGSSILTAQLEPVMVDGAPFYTPVTL